jgi:biotin--protein ligase
MKVIRIYSDTGVQRRSLEILQKELAPLQALSISAQDIKGTPWEESTSLLIIPGGADIPYHEALKGEGNRRILNFIKTGGSFFGICAGAYYGCREVEFDLGMPLEVVGERELAFFPGTARGPAYGPGSFRYESEYGAHPSFISDSLLKGTFKTYFNGGCYFVNAEQYPDITVISKYLDHPEQPAAIIKTHIEQGKVILSGVHIEMGLNTIPTRKMRTSLEPYEPQRKAFFNQLITELL